MSKEKDNEGYEYCDNCIHGYFNGSSYVCGHGLSKYYGMGILSRIKQKCEFYELMKEKRLFYGQN